MADRLSLPVLGMSASREFRDRGIALVLEVLVNSDRGSVIAVDGGPFGGDEKSLFRSRGVFFVLSDLLDQRDLLVRRAIRERFLILALGHLVDRSQTLRPKTLGAFVCVRDDRVNVLPDASGLRAGGMFVSGNDGLGKRLDGLDLALAQELCRARGACRGLGACCRVAGGRGVSRSRFAEHRQADGCARRSHNDLQSLPARHILLTLVVGHACFNLATARASGLGSGGGTVISRSRPLTQGRALHFLHFARSNPSQEEDCLSSAESRCFYCSR